MTQKEYQWYINLVKSRYHDLNLTFEQAEKIYTYEQDKDAHSDTYFFSVWEEWDYELTTFREILNDEQLNIYESSLKENRQRYEQSLVEQDSDKANEFAYYEELINFYETQFLPDFFKNLPLSLSLLSNDNSKIEYLRTEYKQFLSDTKKEVLTNHFRHNRTFKPNEVKISLLRHKLSAMYPNYSSFYRKMDEPTKAVAHYMQSKLHLLPYEVDKLVSRKLNELQEFTETTVKKHYGEPRGWHVSKELLNSEEEKVQHTMTLLLLDKDCYGYKLRIY